MVNRKYLTKIKSRGEFLFTWLIKKKNTLHFKNGIKANVINYGNFVM